MPYYSVHITGGGDCEQASLNAKQAFQGRKADYTGTPSFFYVERSYDKATLETNLRSLVGEYCKIEVRKITKKEFYWQGN